MQNVKSSFLFSHASDTCNAFPSTVTLPHLSLVLSSPFIMMDQGFSAVMSYEFINVQTHILSCSLNHNPC